MDAVSPSEQNLHQARAIANLDSRWAEQLGCEPSILRDPGLHLIRRADMEESSWMGWAVSFLAVLPLHTDKAVTVASFPSVCDALAALDSDVADDALETALFRAAESMGRESTYVFDVLIGWPDAMRLRLDHSVVREHPPGSPNLTTWDGRKTREEVDGPVFTIDDRNGLAAWAGIKRVSKYAQDIYVETREDVRGKGLGGQVASHAIARLIEEGITPYYAHHRGNIASAELARSIGFKPYGSAVVAESRVPQIIP